MGEVVGVVTEIQRPRDWFAEALGRLERGLRLHHRVWQSLLPSCWQLLCLIAVPFGVLQPKQRHSCAFAGCNLMQQHDWLFCLVLLARPAHMLSVVPEFDVACSSWASWLVAVVAGTLMPRQGAKRLDEVRQKEIVGTLNHQLMTWHLSHQETAGSYLAAVAAVLVKHLQAGSQVVNIGDGVHEELESSLDVTCSDY